MAVASAIGKRSAIACAGLLAALCTGCATGETGSPTDVSESGATVGGRVVSDVGGTVEYWVQYGRTTAYGSESAHATQLTVRNAPENVSGIVIGGLARATTYHYRMCARDAQQRGGPGCGADRTLTTQRFGCGETVTTSVRLTGDLKCSRSAGLVVGAPGVDINLAGHLVHGDFSSGDDGPTGISNGAGHADVTIRNGVVAAWGNGIHLEGASRNRIRDVNVIAAAAAILIEGGEANEIRASRVESPRAGVSAIGSDRLVISGSRVEGFGAAINVAGDLATITRNELSGGSEASGIRITGSANRIVDNRVRSFSSGGIVIEAGADNVVAENQVSRSFLTGQAGDRDGDGIFVGAFTAGTLLRSNVAFLNRGDGIEVDATATRLRDNDAGDNGDFGIDAVAGVTDLGGNLGRLNGNGLQCRNVVCS